MIRFTYLLKGAGWAIATVADEETEMAVPASYLCDALRELTDTVHSLFVCDSAECLWEQEPGEVHWGFRRNGANLTVRVRWHDDRESFVGDDDLLHFGSEVDRELDGLLVQWGTEKYTKAWGYPFPREAHAKLKLVIQQERQRRKAIQ
jgi:hypothetical protein